MTYARRIGFATEQRCLPDFLVVAPPKTGTTWLADRLRTHPDLFIPAEKELRYFDHLWRSRDIGWYGSLFTRPAGRLAGDVTPSYALLPGGAIAHLRALRPDLKIVMLMRDPLARAWSHLKHTFLHLEANFAAGADRAAALACDDVAALPTAALLRNLVDDYTLSCGAYDDILRRWGARFRAEQIHITFLEDIAAAPDAEMARLTDFLGVRRLQHVSGEPENAGMPGGVIEALHPVLRALFAARQARITRFLRRTWDRRPPWPRLPAGDPYALDAALGAPITLVDGRFRAPGRRPVWFLGDLALPPGGRMSRADRRLVRVLDALPGPEATQASRPRLVEVRGGFNLVQWRGVHFALRQSVGPVQLHLGAAELRRRFAPADVGIGRSAEEAWRVVHEAQRSGSLDVAAD